MVEHLLSKHREPLAVLTPVQTKPVRVATPDQIVAGIKERPRLSITLDPAFGIVSPQ